MNHAELSAYIAEHVMGWKLVFLCKMLGGDCVSYKDKKGVEKLKSCHLFANDLNACAAAEAKIKEMGLWKEYVDHLQLVPGASTSSSHDRAIEIIVPATAEQRCRAMKMTVDAK